MSLLPVIIRALPMVGSGARKAASSSKFVSSARSRRVMDIAPHLGGKTLAAKVIKAANYGFIGSEVVQALAPNQEMKELLSDQNRIVNGVNVDQQFYLDVMVVKEAQKAASQFIDAFSEGKSKDGSSGEDEENTSFVDEAIKLGVEFIGSVADVLDIDDTVARYIGVTDDGITPGSWEDGEYVALLDLTDLFINPLASLMNEAVAG